MSALTYLITQAWNSLLKRSGFIGTVCSTMGITLGALICISTFAYVLILKPLPYSKQESLFSITQIAKNATTDNISLELNVPGLVEMYNNQPVFSEQALIFYGKKILLSTPEQPTVSISHVTPGWFNLFDVKMAKGRIFDSNEEVNTFHHGAIISYEVWQNMFQGDENILEQKLSFGESSFPIIGVIEKNFIEPKLNGGDFKTEVWLPWDFSFSNAELRTNWQASFDELVYIGQLAEDISVSQAQMLLGPQNNKKWQEAMSDSMFFKDWSVEIELVHLQEVILGGHANTLLLLLAGVLGLVIIATANIINLFSSRTAEQLPKLSIHAALGAKKRDIFRVVLAESTILMALSVIVALIFSYVGFVLIRINLSEVFPRVEELSVDLFTICLALVLLVAFALIFAWFSSRMIDYKTLIVMLKGSGKGTGFQISKRARQLLIVSQIAVVTFIAFINISLLKNSIDSITEPLEFNIERMIDIDLTVSRAPTKEELEGSPLGEAIRNKILELPQVESISAARSPLSGFDDWSFTEPRNNIQFTPDYKSVDSNYFEMIQQPLVEGSYFSASDVKDENLVIIINEELAQHIAPNSSAIGMKLISAEEDTYTIIGVVKSVKIPGSTRIPLRIYVPTSVHSIEMMIKLAPGQELSRSELVSAIKEVTSLLAIYEMTKVTTLQNTLLFSKYMTAITTTSITLLTFLLAGIGLYGVLSYSTQMRRLEIGTRMALGAKKGDLISMVIKDNMPAILLGFFISLILLLVMYNIYAGELSEYIELSLIFTAACTVLCTIAIALISCYGPLRKYIVKPAIYSLRDG
ncbi:hypothetical protein PA25_12150 [Pseudoalteromonas sp. A25]|uniref:ABC transporter permease n=1 Tax=Pseudoalteromonas sp. A25 TaxID=116092 RepID=UPI00126058E4|nr:ABC transporter permease [Pseudoalteromonas sp. A25]BBN81230.1 hypothetical protein PA25_12150 [Pseudoalteromonas sp. A25]